METTAGSRAYESIRQLILDGRLGPGDRIIEEEMREICGTSRTPVREALRRLSSEGLIVFVPHQGAQVATISGEELEDVYRLRAMMESYAAERAAVRISRAQIDRLKMLADSMEEAVLEEYEPINEKFTPANAEFHQIVLDAADSKRLPRIAPMLVEMPLVLRALASYSFEEKLRSATQHHELIAAFEAGDSSWAAATMRGHVLGAYWALARSLSSLRALSDSVAVGNPGDSPVHGAGLPPSSIATLRRDAGRRRLRSAKFKTSTSN
jgi:DNA-binding GntR family transcriptional regulator